MGLRAWGLTRQKVDLVGNPAKLAASFLVGLGGACPTRYAQPIRRVPMFVRNQTKCGEPNFTGPSTAGRETRPCPEHDQGEGPVPPLSVEM